MYSSLTIFDRPSAVREFSFKEWHDLMSQHNANMAKERHTNVKPPNIEAMVRRKKIDAIKDNRDLKNELKEIWE